MKRQVIRDAPYKATDINRWLKDQYGSHTDGRARWRVVWANAETQVRICTKNIFYGPIFLRTEHGAFTEPKYPGPLYENYWILEKLMLESSPDLPESGNGSYEPLFVFKSKSVVALQPTRKAIVFFMYF